MRGIKGMRVTPEQVKGHNTSIGGRDAPRKIKGTRVTKEQVSGFGATRGQKTTTPPVGKESVLKKRMRVSSSKAK